MIQRIQVLHYKALKYIDINLSNFQILVGPNGSGKSTFIDVISLIKDILNESPQSAVEKRVSRFDDIIWKQQGNKFEIALEIQIPEEIKNKLKYKEFSLARYEMSIQKDNEKGIIISGENLWLMREVMVNSTKLKRENSLFPSEIPEPKYVVLPRKRTPSGWRKIISKSVQGNDYFRSETTDWNIIYKFGQLKSSLARVPEDEERFPVAIYVKNILMQGIQFLQLNSNVMRWSCRPDLPITFQPDGSNLPKVIQYLKKERPDSFDFWIKHLQTAISEIKDIRVKERYEDRYLYINVHLKNGLELPSWVISDGTLRLLAQTIIAYLPDKNRIYMIEEPENGLHPLAIESIYQSLSSIYDNQIMLATHSPVILRLAEPKDILCFSKTESGSVAMVRGEDHPNLKDWKKDVDLATLHAAGVLE